MAVVAPAADPVRTYAEAVLGGDVVAGLYVRQAAQRHLDDLAHGHERELAWDQEEADDAIEFFSHLRLYEGDFAGKPFNLQPWQQFCVGSVFGWKLTDGTRRFRTAYLEIAKGNGKTPMAAGVGLKGLTADGEAGAEVYTAGVTRDQASYLLNDASRMVEVSPQLARRIERGAHNLAHPDSGSYMRSVSSEGRSLDQKRVHMALIDEIHEHPTDIVVEKMRAGVKGRRNGLIFEITNAGYDRHSICWQHHQMSVNVLDGTAHNDAWFAFVCSLDEGDDWTDEAVWPKANPNLGVSISHRYLREQVAEAVEMPAKQNLVKRLNFCIWTEGLSKWLDRPKFIEAADVQGPALLPRNREAWGGVDIASTSDLSAFFVLAPRATCDVEQHDGRCYDLRCEFWLPEAAMQVRVRRDHVRYDVWAEAGWITLTRGNRQDQEKIVADILETAARLQLRAIGVDRFNTGWITPRLQDEELVIVEVGQGFLSLSEPAKRIEADIASGYLHHDGNPVLAWMVGNAMAEEDAAGNIKPSRARSMEKIDGVAAWCDALFAWISTPGEADEPSVWEQEGRSLTL